MVKQNKLKIDFTMSVTLSARALPIKSRPMAEPVAGHYGALSLIRLTTKEIIPRSSGPLGEHKAKGAEQNIERVFLGDKFPIFMQ